jgi:NAD(P) transhydrogenase subunit alpha
MSESLIFSISIFVLATFVGIEVISKVPPLLHTPLMSGSNAISGITLVGSLIATGEGFGLVGTYLGLVAVIFAAVNVVGGFLVTDRMLAMFHREPSSTASHHR